MLQPPSVLVMRVARCSINNFGPYSATGSGTALLPLQTNSRKFGGAMNNTVDTGSGFPRIKFQDEDHPPRRTMETGGGFPRIKFQDEDHPPRRTIETGSGFPRIKFQDEDHPPRRGRNNMRYPVLALSSVVFP